MFALAAMGSAESLAAQTQPPRDRPPAAAKERAASITGRVLAGDTRAPLVRAVVRLTSSALPRPRVTRTDQNAGFTFDGLPAGAYSLTGAKPRYVTISFGQRRPYEGGRVIELRESQALKGIDLLMPRAGAISGIARDTAGEPVETMRMIAFRLSFVDGRRRLAAVAQAVTDDIGQFRLSGLPPGEYFVVAREWGARPGELSDEPTGYGLTFYPGTLDERIAQRIKVAEGQEVTNLEFPLMPARTARLSGVVVHVDGRPVPGPVRLTDSVRSGTGGNVSGGATADALGRFTVSGVRAGDYQLMAGNSPDAGTLPVQVTDGDLTGLTIVVGRGAAMTGRVVPSTGFSLPFAPSAVELTARLIGDPFHFNTGTGGVVAPDWTVVWRGQTGPRLIRATRLPSGWWLKTVLQGTTDITDTAITLAHGQTIPDLTIVLDDRPTTLTGTVLGATGTVPDYILVAFAEDAARWGPETRFVRAARPDLDGRFSTIGLPPERYLLAAVDYVENGQWFDPEYLESLRRVATRVTLEPGQKATVELRLVDPR